MLDWYWMVRTCRHSFSRFYGSRWIPRTKPLWETDSSIDSMLTCDIMIDNYQFASFPGFQKLLGDAPNLVIDPSLKPSSNMPYEATQVATSPGTPSSSTVAATPTQTRATPSSSSSSSRRKSGAVSTTSASLEEASRLAAEEDKRRRNTAASARFRVKKKQREQTLERTAKEMTEKVGQLEARIGQLETENKWLKNLITEKNGSPSSSSSLSRSTAEKKDGVGTAAAAAAGLKP